MPGRTLRPTSMTRSSCCPRRYGRGCRRDHLASFVADLVLTPILKTDGGVTRDTVPSNPRMRVAVLLYAYAGGVPAAWQIARVTLRPLPLVSQVY
jgi:hypothetical protein